MGSLSKIEPTSAKLVSVRRNTKQGFKIPDSEGFPYQSAIIHNSFAVKSDTKFPAALLEKRIRFLNVKISKRK
jgi:hypothetical protein